MRSILFILTGLILGFMAAALFNKRNAEIRYVTDTISIVHIDTIALKELVPIYRHIVDTVYVDRPEDNIPLPIEQLRYHEHGLYDIWLSGYKPKLDSIKLYETFSQKIITNNVYISRKRWAISPYIGINASKAAYRPTIGISFLSPKRWMLNVEMGLGEQNHTQYGLRIGKNILAN